MKNYQLNEPYRSAEIERLADLIRNAIGKRTSTSATSSTSGESLASTLLKQKPVAGESWWVKVPNQDRLVLVEIREISFAMVNIRVVERHIDGHALRTGRYERNYLKFVEKHVPSLEPESV